MATAKKRVFETFRAIGDFEVHSLSQAEPSCFNGSVRVVKYRVTVEQVDEPIEVIQARVQSLIDGNKNMHHYGPLSAAAKKYGL